MIGKNPLWVAKQHGHSIATMLRAYAAWAEGTAEVDVEAIKRSTNATEAPPTRNLAVAEALQSKRALALRSPHRISSLRASPLRGRPRRVNLDEPHPPTPTAATSVRPTGRAPRTLSRHLAINAKARRLAGFCAFMAGVAGFEPTNGGIKTR